MLTVKTGSISLSDAFREKKKYIFITEMLKKTNLLYQTDQPRTQVSLLLSNINKYKPCLLCHSQCHTGRKRREMEYLQHCVCHIVLKLMLFEKKTYNIARLQRVSLKTGNEELTVIVVKLKRLSCFDWSHGFTFVLY